LNLGRAYFLEGFFVILDAASMNPFSQVFIDFEQFVSRLNIIRAQIVVDFAVGHIFMIAQY
jgi:hypothetical protein